MDDHLITNQGMKNGDIGANMTMTTNAHIGANHGIGRNGGTFPDLHPWPDNDARIKRNAGLEPRIRMNR